MKSSFYPIFLSLGERLCVVVGGGEVAERKVRGLVRAGAVVRIVSPEVTRGIERLALRGRVEIIRRPYRRGDLEGATLAFAATGTEEVSTGMKEEALRLSVPLNVVDKPDSCDFIVPSVVERDPILVAISTSGMLPMLSKRLRKEVAANLTADYAAYARRVGRFRAFLLKRVVDARRRKEILKAIGRAEIAEVSRMSLKEMKERFL